MIEFKKTNLDKLDEYISLYSKAFRKFSKTEEYFKWLYQENPDGKFVGIDCYDNNILVGQVGGIPHEFVFNQKKINFLISINVCVDPKYQGKWLFSKMLVRFEQIAKELDFDGIIGIANKAATPFWQRSIKMKTLGSLDVFIGYGKLDINNFDKLNYNFYTFWNERKLNWRFQNPLNNFYQKSSKESKSIFTKTEYLFIDAYSPLVFFDKNINLRLEEKKIFKPVIYIGIINDFKKTTFLFDLPNFLKPSPLNLVYKFLKSEQNLDPKKMFFTFLEFDAF